MVRSSRCSAAQSGANVLACKCQHLICVRVFAIFIFADDYLLQHQPHRSNPPPRQTAAQRRDPVFIPISKRRWSLWRKDPPARGKPYQRPNPRPAERTEKTRNGQQPDSDGAVIVDLDAQAHDLHTVLRCPVRRHSEPRPSSPETLHQRHPQPLPDLRYRPRRHREELCAGALAAQALEAGQIDRIILTRPAVEAGEQLGFLPVISTRSSRPTSDAFP